MENDGILAIKPWLLAGGCHVELEPAMEHDKIYRFKTTSQASSDIIALG